MLKSRKEPIERKMKRKWKKRFLRSKKIPLPIPEKDDTDKEQVSERALQSEYEDITKREALTDGIPTKEYITWKEQRMRFEYLLTITNGGNDNDTVKGKSKKEIHNERISKIAFEISRRFPYHKIIAAIDGKGGYEVHAWIQENYDDYEDLIDSYVLDRACLYAKRINTKKAINFLSEIDIENMEMTKVDLKRELILKNYPGLKFKQVIILADGYLEEGLTWIYNYPHEVDGYDVRVTYAPANTAMLGCPIWNLLVLVVLHAPGKNQGIYKATMKANALLKLDDDIKSKIIHQFSTYVKPLEDKLDEAERNYLQSEKKYMELIKKIETKTPSDIMQEYHQMKRYETKTYRDWNIDWKNVFYLILIIVIFGFMIWAFMYFGNLSASQMNNSTLISNINTLKNLRC